MNLFGKKENLVGRKGEFILKKKVEFKFIRKMEFILEKR